MTIRVYVAGPYSADPEACTAEAIRVATLVLDAGYAPLVPHLKHPWVQSTDRPYEDWLRLDLAWVEAADVLLRMPGKSPGADREVEHARALGVPVVTSVEGLAEWVRAEARS